MSERTLPAFSPSTFPQPTYGGEFLDRLTRLAEKAITASELGSCCFDRCQAKAEVSEVETGIGYCDSHFRGVSRG